MTPSMVDNVTFGGKGNLPHYISYLQRLLYSLSDGFVCDNQNNDVEVNNSVELTVPVYSISTLMMK